MKICLGPSLVQCNQLVTNSRLSTVSIPFLSSKNMEEKPLLEGTPTESSSNDTPDTHTNFYQDVPPLLQETKLELSQHCFHMTFNDDFDSTTLIIIFLEKRITNGVNEARINHLKTDTTCLAIEADETSIKKLMEEHRTKKKKDYFSCVYGIAKGESYWLICHEHSLIDGRLSLCCHWIREQSKGINILCLDGGGAKSLITIQLLMYIHEQAKKVCLITMLT